VPSKVAKVISVIEIDEGVSTTFHDIPSGIKSTPHTISEEQRVIASIL